MTLTQSEIPGRELLHRGKVRETYAVGDDRLLLIATDRLSAFDVVFDQPIPDKGRLLTALSAFWFRELESLGATHFISTAADQLPPGARTPELAGRVTIAKLDIEESPTTPSRYGVRGIPTMMLFKDGQMASMKVGAMPKQKILEWLAEAGLPVLARHAPESDESSGVVAVS